MKIESREYKLLVQHESFNQPAEAVASIWNEIEETVRTLPGIRTKGTFDEKDVRSIQFLDTPGHSLRGNGLVLRRRSDDQAVEYTLKCRSEDRYFAAGTHITAAEGFDSKPKLEEDIAPPFVCRFSHSATISGDKERASGLKTLRDAAALFPVLGTVRADGRACDPETALTVVNSITVNETVWKGGKVVFASNGEDKSDKAALALILWTRGQAARPVVAELSFRIKDDEEKYSRHLAEAARSVYTLLQRLDCARSAGITKTEYIYRDASWD